MDTQGGGEMKMDTQGGGVNEDGYAGRGRK